MKFNLEQEIFNQLRGKGVSFISVQSIRNWNKVAQLNLWRAIWKQL